jgi:hypothetical protein
MRRKLALFVLGLGTLAGFASGFHALRHGLHHGHWHSPCFMEW